MAQRKVSGGDRARITSSGWNLKDGAHANISLPGNTDPTTIVSFFKKALGKRGKKDRLPRELRREAEVAFSPVRGKLLVKVRVLSQDTRGDNFVDYVAAGILKLRRKG